MVTHQIVVCEIRSASKKVKCAKIIVKAISVCSLFLIVLIIYENHTPIPTHKTIPHTIIPIKLKMPQMPVAKLRGCLVASRMTRKRATAVPSLNKLSPSSIKRSLFGIHISFAIDKIATGSVEEIMIPKSNITTIGMSIHMWCKSRCPHHAMMVVEIRSQIVANDHIGR